MSYKFQIGDSIIYTAPLPGSLTNQIGIVVPRPLNPFNQKAKNHYFVYFEYEERRYQVHHNNMHLYENALDKLNAIL